MMVRGSGASGKSAKRRQWRKKRADFEEVPRLAATTMAGNRLARRWAAAAPYGGLIDGAEDAILEDYLQSVYRINAAVPCKKRGNAVRYMYWNIPYF